MDKQEIDGYYISDDNELHTYIGNEKHFVISDVKTDKQANEIIKELNKESEEEMNEADKRDIKETVNILYSLVHSLDGYDNEDEYCHAIDVAIEWLIRIEKGEIK